MPGKYKFVNGVMVPINQPAGSHPPLAILSTQDQIAEATTDAAQQGISLQIPMATVVAIEKFDQEDLNKQYNTSRPLDRDKIFEQITHMFSQYEVPIGLLPKLLGLENYNLNFILDDSGSMGSKTDGVVKQTCAYFKTYLKSRNRDAEDFLTRWEEAEDIMHIMVDLLPYIPTKNISICFLNRSNRINLNRSGETPLELATRAHLEIRLAFQSPPNGGTPLRRALSDAFVTASYNGNTMHYLFTDGEPSDCTIPELQKLIMKRSLPERCPLTLVGCTDDEKDIEWMERMEVYAPFVCAVDYFEEERQNIVKLQGPMFPYTKGIWIMCLLVGAINPDDLDDLDSPHPLTKFTLDNLLGRHTTPQEYELYWANNPHSHNFRTRKTAFTQEETCARMLVGRTSMSALQGVFNGMRLF